MHICLKENILIGGKGTNTGESDWMRGAAESDVKKLVNARQLFYNRYKAMAPAARANETIQVTVKNVSRRESLLFCFSIISFV